MLASKYTNAWVMMLVVEPPFPSKTASMNSQFANSAFIDLSTEQLRKQPGTTCSPLSTFGHMHCNNTASVSTDADLVHVKCARVDAVRGMALIGYNMI